MTSRSKGNAAEREVAKLLGKWWDAAEPGTQWCRTPMSGGFSTPVIRHGFNLSGDLMTTSNRFPFVVECKRREAWSPKWLVAGRQSPVWTWWKQSLTQAAESKKEPMLWMRRNAERPKGVKFGGAMPPVWLVMVTKSLWDSAAGVPYPDLVWDPAELRANGVDYWEVLPVGIMAYRLLAMDPKVFLR